MTTPARTCVRCGLPACSKPKNVPLCKDCSEVESHAMVLRLRNPRPRPLPA